MTTTKDTIKINGDEFEVKIAEALRSAREQWSGWKVPVWLDEDTGNLSIGAPYSNEIIVPGLHQIFAAKSWEITNDDNYDAVVRLYESAKRRQLKHRVEKYESDLIDIIDYHIYDCILKGDMGKGLIHEIIEEENSLREFHELPALELV